MEDRNLQTENLLKWYDQNHRSLPWREEPTPYHIWISEIMLQQTRVETVRPYYLRFLETLPDIASLAAAQEGVYLKLWEGLGYYSRVRHLHAAAVRIMEDYQGQMPSSVEELVKLPGIGPYTAAAIASIAFGQPAVSVDGNLLRIYARMIECCEDIRSAAAKKAAGDWYRERLAAERPGDFNQALMDLGATVCLPNGIPRCDACPWKADCLAFRHKTAESYPIRTAHKPRRIEERTILLLHCNGQVAIRRRPDEGLLAGLYEFPGSDGILDPEEALDYARALGVLPAEGTAAVRKLSDARHIFTHVEWNMVGYLIKIPGIVPEDRRNGLIWVNRTELENVYSIPSAFEVYRRDAMDCLSEGLRESGGSLFYL